MIAPRPPLRWQFEEIKAFFTVPSTKGRIVSDETVAANFRWDYRPAFEWLIKIGRMQKIILTGWKTAWKWKEEIP